MSEQASVLDHAKRLLGGAADLMDKSDPAIRRLVVDELLGEKDRSDAFNEGAFAALVDGDARVVIERRRLRVEAGERQIELLRRAGLGGAPN